MVILSNNWLKGPHLPLLWQICNLASYCLCSSTDAPTAPGTESDTVMVYVWGSNSSHQLAEGTLEKILLPKLTQGFSDAQMVWLPIWLGLTLTISYFYNYDLYTVWKIKTFQQLKKEFLQAFSHLLINLNYILFRSTICFVLLAKTNIQYVHCLFLFIQSQT